MDSGYQTDLIGGELHIIIIIIMNLDVTINTKGALFK